MQLQEVRLNTLNTLNTESMQGTAAFDEQVRPNAGQSLTFTFVVSTKHGA